LDYFLSEYLSNLIYSSIKTLFMISVVIANYNTKKSIVKTLDSLKHQNHDIEIIVVDDASTDQSVDVIISNFQQVKLFINKSNLGRAQSRNIGMQNAKGDWILFIDSDVWLDKNTLDNLLDYRNNFDLIYPKLIFQNGTIKHSKPNQKYPTDTGCFLANRAKINNILFDTNFKYLEDQDFFIRCYLCGLKAKYVKSAVAYHQDPEITNYGSKKYFDEMSDIFYGIKKFSQQTKKIGFKHHFKKINLIKGLAAAIFNYNYFLYNQNISTIKKIINIFTPHKKFEVKNVKLIKLFFVAIKKKNETFNDFS